LTDVWDEDLIKFFQSGASVHLKMPTSIVELRGEGGATECFPTYDRWLNYCSFCRQLRGELEGGEEACTRCDAQNARDFLNGRLKPLPGRKALSYHCHMGLSNHVAPIEVEGCRVATLFAGQMRAACEKELADLQLADIRRHVDEIGGPRSSIQASPEERQILRSLIEEIPREDAATLTRLESEAEGISGFAAEAWRRKKEQREDAVLANLDFQPTGDGQALDSGLKKLLEDAVKWCGVEFAVAFTAEQSEKPFLGKFVHFGVPDELLAEPLQFNWGKAGPPLPSSGPVDSKLDNQLVARGTRGPRAKALAERIEFAYAVALGTEHRMVLCLGRRKDGLSLGNEFSFLSRLASAICHPYLERQQFLEVRDLKEHWEDVASLIGHEVRNSITGIVNETQVAEDFALTEKPWISKERAEEAFRTVKEECMWLSVRASETLEFWHSIGGRTHRKFEQRSLRDIVETCGEGARALAGRRNLEIRIDLPPYRLPLIWALGRTLEIAIGNILENAVKYSFDGRYIVLRVRTSKGWVTIEIENYGIGIPEKERELVFEKRYRGKYRGSQTVRQGEGLGTWQAREIARAHGGDITCSSRSGDRQPQEDDVDCFKTVFTITLPLDQYRRKEEEI